MYISDATSMRFQLQHPTIPMAFEGPALSSLQPLTDSMQAAEEALVDLHASGAAHNDVRWGNFVLQGTGCLLLFNLL